MQVLEACHKTGVGDRRGVAGERWLDKGFLFVTCAADSAAINVTGGRRSSSSASTGRRRLRHTSEPSWPGRGALLSVGPVRGPGQAFAGRRCSLSNEPEMGEESSDRQASPNHQSIGVASGSQALLAATPAAKHECQSEKRQPTHAAPRLGTGR